MDPSGTLGLVLGLPGLVVACADIYRHTLTGKRRDKDSQLLLTKVAIEQAKFHQWLYHAGLINPGSRPTIAFSSTTGNVIRAAMEGIRRVLQDLGRIIEKYDIDDHGDVNELNFWLPDRFWEDASSSGASYQPDTQFQASVRRRILDRVTRKVRTLEWAAGDMEQSRRLIDDLRGFNEDLRCLVHSPLQVSTLPSQILPQVLEPAQLANLVTASKEEYPELGYCALFKAAVLRLELEKANPIRHDDPLRAHHQRLSKQLSSLNMDRCFLKYQLGGESVDVLLESRPYHVKQDQAYEKSVHRRIHEIAHLLAQAPKPKQFNTLDCLGYVQDRPRHRYCFIFRLLDGLDYTAHPMTLRQVYADGAFPTEIPSLGTRFQTALSVSLSLLYLHACGIVHKDYRAENLLIFRKPGETSFSVSSPTLLGFDYARPHGSLFTSDSVEHSATGQGRLHLHPEYKPEHQARYLKVYDLYELGILLVEIALWEGAGKSIPGNTPRQRVREILIEQAKAMRSIIGDIYVDVALRCLTSDIHNVNCPDHVADITVNDENEQENVDLQRAFVHNIVEPLSKCCA